MRKVRPIGLAEHLVKFAEQCAVVAELEQVLLFCEPRNLGLTPDGVVMDVRMLRGWVADIAGAPGAPEPDVAGPPERHAAGGAVVKRHSVAWRLG